MEGPYRAIHPFFVSPSKHLGSIDPRRINQADCHHNAPPGAMLRHSGHPQPGRAGGLAGLYARTGASLGPNCIRKPVGPVKMPEPTGFSLCLWHPQLLRNFVLDCASGLPVCTHCAPLAPLRIIKLQIPLSAGLSNPNSLPAAV